MAAILNLNVDQAADMSFGVVWRTAAPAGTWQPASDYGVGDNVLPVQSNGFVFTCSTAGMSDQFQPSWPCQLGETVTDGSVVWTTTGPDVVPIDLSVGWSAFMSVGLRGVEPIVTVTDEPGSAGQITLGADGSIKVVILGAETLGFTAPSYLYDLFLVNTGSSTPYTTELVRGAVTVNPNTTTPVW
jgi:hypothetical protein